MEHLLNKKDDLDWLFSTHLKTTARLTCFRSFVIHGNEDCPTKLELYDRVNPLVSHRPVATFVLNKETSTYDRFFG